MMVYQMHPDHGRHIAYTSLESEDNLKNGWKTVTKKEFYAQGEAIGRKDVTASQPKEKKGKKK